MQVSIILAIIEVIDSQHMWEREIKFGAFFQYVYVIVVTMDGVCRFYGLCIYRRLNGDLWFGRK